MKKEQFENVLKEIIVISYEDGDVREFLNDFKRILEHGNKQSTKEFTESLNELQQKHRPTFENLNSETKARIRKAAE